MKKEEKNGRNANKERIAELKEQKRAMQKELDELNGNTARGKMTAVFVFPGIMLAFFAVFIGLVKFNAGGIADQVLAPVIGDVPVVRSILPQRLQRKNASEVAAEKKAAADAKAAQKAAEQAARDAKKQAAAQAKATARAQASAQAQLDAQASADARATAQAEKDAQLQDYADTYAKMDPAQAASIFNQMMSDDVALVARILQNMPAGKRAQIIGNMDPLSAAKITSVMKK